MKIGLAQIASIKGEIDDNIEHHLRMLKHFYGGPGDLVVFPELSLSNYDPDIAAVTATAPNDARLDVFQRCADSSGISVGAGIPTTGEEKPYISLVLFRPGENRRVLSKRYLHPDEYAFFSPSNGSIGVVDFDVKVALAICFEISVPAHIQAATKCGIDLYLATVAKTAHGIREARAVLSAKARHFRLPILLVNSIGRCEGKEAGGGSMVINDKGVVIGQLSSTDEGFLVYDSAACTALSIIMSEKAQ